MLTPNINTYYDVFIAHEWLIPATADLTGKTEAEIRKIWDKAQKKSQLCTFKVLGDLPPSKRCALCNTLARKSAMDCKTCGDIFSE